MSCEVRETILPRRNPGVSVNGVKIPRDLIAREIQNHPAQSATKAWTAAARSLVVRELLLQEARRLGIEAQPRDDGEGRRETSEEAAVRALIEQEVKIPSADPEDCRRYYQRNRVRFRSPDIYEAAHILISAPQGDKQAYEQARAATTALLAQIKARPDDFADCARLHSACPSREHGGHLGQISAGQTTPEFERALAGLSEGEISAEPVATRYGFHIIRLDRKSEGRILPFEAVAERIAGYLTESVRHRATAQIIARLTARAAIAGVEMPSLESYRVN